MAVPLTVILRVSESFLSRTFTDSRPGCRAFTVIVDEESWVSAVAGLEFWMLTLPRTFFRVTVASSPGAIFRDEGDKERACA